MQCSHSSGKRPRERSPKREPSGTTEAGQSSAPAAEPAQPLPIIHSSHPSHSEFAPPLYNCSSTSYSSNVPLPKRLPYWQPVRAHMRKLKNAMISEVSTINSSDSRPHATVFIKGCHIRGLLDSGASISCFGCNALSRIEQLGLRLKSINQSVQTADGHSQTVVGFVETDISFKAKPAAFVYMQFQV